MCFWSINVLNEDAMVVLHTQARSNRDGAGFVCLTCWEYFKHLKWHETRQQLYAHYGHIVAVHLRLSSTGTVSHYNVQPINIGKYFIMHNGDWSTEANYQDKKGLLKKGKSDSWVLAKKLVSAYNKDGKDGVLKIMKEVSGYDFIGNYIFISPEHVITTLGYGNYSTWEESFYLDTSLGYCFQGTYLTKEITDNPVKVEPLEWGDKKIERTYPRATYYYGDGYSGYTTPRNSYANSALYPTTNDEVLKMVFTHDEGLEKFLNEYLPAYNLKGLSKHELKTLIQFIVDDYTRITGQIFNNYEGTYGYFKWFSVNALPVVSDNGTRPSVRTDTDESLNNLFNMADEKNTKKADGDNVIVSISEKKSDDLPLLEEKDVVPEDEDSLPTPPLNDVNSSLDYTKFD